MYVLHNSAQIFALVAQVRRGEALANDQVASLAEFAFEQVRTKGDAIRNRRDHIILALDREHTADLSARAAARAINNAIKAYETRKYSRDKAKGFATTKADALIFELLKLGVSLHDRQMRHVLSRTRSKK